MPVMLHVMAYCLAWAAAVGSAAAGLVPVAILLVLVMAAVVLHRQVAQG